LPCIKSPLPWRQLLKAPDLAGFFLFRFVYTVCIGIIWGFLPVLGDAEFHLSASAIGILVMLGVLVSGLIQAPMGWVSDRYPKKPLVVCGGLVAGGAIFSFYWADGFWPLFIANLVFGIGGGVSMPALMGLTVVKGSRTESMGSVMSLMTFAHSAGMLFGSLLAGVAMDGFTLRGAFPAGALVMAAGVALFALLTPSEEHRARV